jgi:hypothetical protein
MSGRAITRFEKPDPNGWGLSMIVVELDDGVLVYSPTYDGDATFERLEALGTPRVLVAPNHFHHLSLARFVARYPQAAVVASEKACPRLRKRGHAVQPLSSVTLPDDVRWLVPEGTRAGEAFISTIDRDGARAWIVCDAFFNVERPVTGMAGVVLRALDTTPGLSLGKTFRWLALDDRRAYAAWMLDALARERPTRLYVSHGETAQGDDLADRLAQIVKQRL